MHVAINGPDRAVAVCNGLRNFLPELLALSASSPFVENVNTGLHSARSQIFTRPFPRCGIPDAYDGWDGFERYVRFLYDTRSISEHTQLWWSVRPHLAFPTVEIRICDGQPDLGEARSLAALGYALAARIARALDEGEPVPDFPHRLIEENLWRAIRYGLSGELIDLATGETVRARAPRAPGRVGAADGRGARLRRAARDSRGQRRRAPDRAPRGGRRPARDLRRTTGRVVGEDEQRLIAELQAELAKLTVTDLLLQTLHSLSLLGYQRLSGEGRDLPQAKLAIESLRALVPVLEGSAPEEALRDFGQLLAGLQLAYATAVSEDPEA